MSGPDCVSGREEGRAGWCGRGLGRAWLWTWEPMNAEGQDVPTPRLRNAKDGREPEKQEGQGGGKRKSRPGFQTPPGMEGPEAEPEEPKLSSKEV